MGSATRPTGSISPTPARRHATTGRSCTSVRRGSRRTTCSRSARCCWRRSSQSEGALRVSGLSARRLSPHFFALGAAFLLLETRSITVFGLLFGTTWYVNALVIAGILLSVLAAIGVNALLRPRSAVPFYIGLAVALAANVAMPPTTLLIEPASLRDVLATALAFSPVFFANLVFTHAFRDAADADLAFASNLLGAVVGGALEYVALEFGYAALIVVAAALYVAAYVFVARVRIFGDRRLPAFART